MVRILARLERKDRDRRAQSRSGANPFLPYDERLFVADVSDTHVCLLNKFNVLDHHLLLVTRAFEAQDERLTTADFEALLGCLVEGEALGFYNSGPVASASQPHKHLQVVPLPLAGALEGPPAGGGAAREVGGTPLEPWLEVPDGVGAAPRLPFVHALAATPEEPAAARARYLELLRAADAEARPYNLVVTPRWMLLVPRSRAAWQGIEVNALGFVGALLVRDREKVEVLRRVGPLRLLREVGFQPRSAS